MEIRAQQVSPTTTTISSGFIIENTIDGVVLARLANTFTKTAPMTKVKPLALVSDPSSRKPISRAMTPRIKQITSILTQPSVRFDSHCARQATTASLAMTKLSPL